MQRVEHITPETDLPGTEQARGGEIETCVANRLASGAPGSIRLGGKTYLVGQPTDNDHAALSEEFCKIVQRDRREVLLKLMGEGHTLAQAKELQDELWPMPDPKTPEGLQHVSFSTEGCRALAYVLIRKEQPDVAAAELRAAIDEHNAAAIAGELLRECGLMGAAPNSVGGTGSIAPSGPTKTEQPSTAS